MFYYNLIISITILSDIFMIQTRTNILNIGSSIYFHIRVTVAALVSTTEEDEANKLNAQ